MGLQPGPEVKAVQQRIDEAQSLHNTARRKVFTVAGESHQVGNQMTIAISTYDVAEARRMFDALQQGGQVTMPMQATPFSPAYGRVTDKFGISFQIAAQFSD